MRKQVLFATVTSVIVFTSVHAQNTFPSSGNVGIGTTAPASKLNIVDMVNTGSGYYKPLRIYNPNLATGEHLQINFGKANSAYNQAEIGFNLAGGTGSANNTLTFGMYGNPFLLTLKGNSYVGIGTATPAAVLDIAGQNNWDANTTEGDFRIGNPTYRLKIGVATSGAGAGDARIRAAGGTNRLILGPDVFSITGAGNVGVGTLNPTAKLHVVGNQTLSGNLSFTSGLQSIQFANPGSPSNPMMYMFSSGTQNYSRMVIGHSPAFPTWGLQYNDSVDRFDFLGAGISRLSINLGSGNIGIGTVNPAYKLSVNGTIQAKEVRVETGWADYVFEKTYKLPSLENVEKYIEQNKHLPGIASAKEIQEKGVAVGEIVTKMMEKIEELTLYNIQLQKQSNQLQKQVNLLQQHHRKGR